jgi:hypothetical protein
VFAALALAVQIAPTFLHAQFATSDRLSQPGFWPTQEIYPRDSYTGPVACADCHAQIYREAEHTSMARTFMIASESNILKAHPDLAFASGINHYSIQTARGSSTYIASNELQQKSAQLAWAFGTDRVAQSWLFQDKNGNVREARVTYFRTLDGLSFTPGRAVPDAENLQDAMYREVGRAEVYACFGCHTTASGFGSSFDPRHLTPGVSCEACHGPGKVHADLMGDISFTQKVRYPRENTDEKIFNPAKLSPSDSVDFCGACHGSYWDVSLSGSVGVGNVRFQPYRLEESKCWKEGNDSRLTCLACHDPHKQVDTVATDYDHVCLSCHAPKTAGTHPVAIKRGEERHTGAVCPVATHKCTTCHMPEVYVPSMQSSFPDHDIRIARTGELFPD